jgi:hypothetical protein
LTGKIFISNPSNLMLKLIASNAIVLVLIGIASAETLKCTVDGEILYTDDARLCANSEVKRINGNVSVFPGINASKNNIPMATPAAQPTAKPDSTFTDSLLEKFGLSQQDIANGWKTIMDASHRGSWQAPEMPQEEQ